MTPGTATFHVADYAIFLLVLIISAGIGIFYGVQARRSCKSATETLLTGGKKLKMIPVTMSLLASFMSAIFILGSPAEVYTSGGVYWLISAGNVPAILLTAIFILPIFHRLKLTSAYEYLEIRFSRSVRVMGSLTFSVQMLLYMAVVLYTPALALSQVMNLSMEISILTMGLVCTFYTAIGGIKAVVWTDAFQVVIITVGMLVLLVKGVQEVGGMDTVMERVKQGSRLPYFDPDPDPTVRYTFWSLFVGGAMMTMTIYGSNQAMLQRYMSMKTLKDAEISLLLALPGSMMYQALVCLIGLVMYAYYHDCDPLNSGVVNKRDQLVPLFIMDLLGSYPGLPGLMVACIFSAALSTISSGVNSMAAVALEDFIKPLLKAFHFRTSDRTLSVLTVLLALLFGITAVGLAYLLGVLEKTVLQITFSIFGMVGGPLLGLIISGIFLPWINAWGAGVGLVVSLAACFWVGLGAILNPVSRPTLPYFTDGCNISTDLIFTTESPSLISNGHYFAEDVFIHHVHNVTHDLLDPGGTFYKNLSSVALTKDYSITKGSMQNSTPSATPDIHVVQRSGVEVIYGLSYLHYSTLAVIVSVIVGLVVSAITGFNKRSEVDSRTYFHFCCYAQSSYHVNSDAEMHLRDGVGNHLLNTQGSADNPNIENVQDGVQTNLNQNGNLC